MRVYEFAKQYSLSSKELLEALKKEGVVLKSHMSMIPEESLVFLKEKFALKQEGSSPSSNVGVMEKNKEQSYKAKAPVARRRPSYSSQKPSQRTPFGQTKTKKI